MNKAIIKNIGIIALVGAALIFVVFRMNLFGSKKLLTGQV